MKFKAEWHNSHRWRRGPACSTPSSPVSPSSWNAPYSMLHKWRYGGDSSTPDYVGRELSTPHIFRRSSSWEVAIHRRSHGLGNWGYPGELVQTSPNHFSWPISIWISALAAFGWRARCAGSFSPSAETVTSLNFGLDGSLPRSSLSFDSAKSDGGLAPRVLAILHQKLNLFHEWRPFVCECRDSRDTNLQGFLPSLYNYCSNSHIHFIISLFIVVCYR